MQPPPARPPLSDSPWFWVYLFCTAGLVMLFLAGPKYIDRQTQIENQAAARERSWQLQRGEAPSFPVVEDGRVRISLFPLYLVLSVGLAGGWIVVWFQRFREVRAVSPVDATIASSGASWGGSQPTAPAVSEGTGNSKVSP